MNKDVEFTISYQGASSDEHLIDLYDVTQALLGFQRSLALTTHLVLNNEIITQTPFMKGANIYALPSESGSWKMTAVISVTITGLFNAGTAPTNTPFGHIVSSMYDYVISESLGFHVDYEKSLGKSYKELQEQQKNQEKAVLFPTIEQSAADSLIEKCSTAVCEMHRPIYKTKTATSARIKGIVAGQIKDIGKPLDSKTYEYIHITNISESTETVIGLVSSYNSNTYKGRIYIPEIGRPVTFELSDKIRSIDTVKLITASLSTNAIREYNNPNSLVRFTVLKNTSRSGHLKSLTVLSVSSGVDQ